MSPNSGSFPFGPKHLQKFLLIDCNNFLDLLGLTFLTLVVHCICRLSYAKQISEELACNYTAPQTHSWF